MFTALYAKEWKEKATVFFFELGILALLILAQFVFQQKRDIREWLVYAVLMLFFPFAALVLGASGFEAEYRQGAWAYLFSRPVRKSTIWLAKFVALLSMLAALWLVFAVLWAAAPGVRELRAWPVLGKTGLMFESGFPWWSIFLSGLLLTIAFSLSLLHERQFNILFVSLAAAFFFPVAAWAVMNSRASGFMAWIAPSKALPTFLLSQALIGVAFAASSVLTLVRSDFSQPRKLSLGFVRWFAPLFVLALAATAAWALLVPVAGERFLYFTDYSGGDPYYLTERGIFKYSAAGDRVQWLARSKQVGYFATSAAGGKVVYTAFDIKGKNDIVEELWIVNADGSGRRRIIGRAPRESQWPQETPIYALLPSPDGSRIAILSNFHNKKRPPLWTINADGSRLENLPGDPSLFGAPTERYYFYLMAWTRDSGGLLILRRLAAKPMTFSLWLYDLGHGAAKMILDNAVPASWRSSVSPKGDFLALKYQKASGRPSTFGLLDLRSLQVSDITMGAPGNEVRDLSRVSWDQDGGRLAYLGRRAQAGGKDVYVLGVYSLGARTAVAERVITESEASAQLLSPSWTADGGKLVLLDRERNGLRVLGPDLREVELVAFPRWLTNPVGLTTAGNEALVEDDKTESLWRLDLAEKRWKRLY